MLILERTWQEAWFFLSLDVTRPFFKELWFSIDEPMKFQETIRNVIRPTLIDEIYYHNGKSICYQTTSTFLEVYGPTQLNHLALWISRIFLSEGPDRLSETLWQSISLRISAFPNNEYTLPQWILELMSKIREYYETEEQKLEQKIDKVYEDEESEWDTLFFPFQHTDFDNVITTISLISTYNIFVAAWAKHASELSYEQLYELWTLAKPIAVSLKMEEEKLTFPNFWHFELSPFLASCKK